MSVKAKSDGSNLKPLKNIKIYLNILKNCTCSGQTTTSTTTQIGPHLCEDVRLYPDANINASVFSMSDYLTGGLLIRE
jgi:hypothetical protein